MEPGTFRLTEATAGEKLARDRLTFEAWGRRLTREQYLARERLLRATDHSRLHLHTWVLRAANDVVLANCETYRLPLLPGGAVEVVASVYVDGALRGARLASRLMDAVVASRREAGLDALVLFSEVGTALYARSGFRPLPAPTRGFAAGSRTTEDLTTPLGRDDLPAALEARARWRSGALDLALTPEIVDWHLARSHVYEAALGLADTGVVGARTEGAQALWCADGKNDCLRLLDVSGLPGSALAPLLDAAGRDARARGLSRLELWDDAHSLRFSGGERFERDDDVPMGVAFTPRGELFLGPLSRATWA